MNYNIAEGPCLKSAAPKGLPIPPLPTPHTHYAHNEETPPDPRLLEHEAGPHHLLHPLHQLPPVLLLLPLLPPRSRRRR